MNTHFFFLSLLVYFKEIRAYLCIGKVVAPPRHKCYKRWYCWQASTTDRYLPSDMHARKTHKRAAAPVQFNSFHWWNVLLNLQFNYGLETLALTACQENIFMMLKCKWNARYKWHYCNRMFELWMQTPLIESFSKRWRSQFGTSFAAVSAFDWVLCLIKKK